MYKINSLFTVSVNNKVVETAPFFRIVVGSQ